VTKILLETYTIVKYQIEVNAFSITISILLVELDHKICV